jgi:2-polyprenyl-3-methyl-5-hydroxy-6-metoxy-1,4-benzoquinol methylase
MARSRYDTSIDLRADNAHTRVIRLVGERKQVLELGCATGYMSKVLVEQFGCTVVGIELGAEAAEEAGKVCSRVIVGDLDTLDLGRELSGSRFDVIVCADVLEHLRDPVRTLASLRPLLAPDGYLVASIPNIAHVAVIVELLEGRFPYRPTGLLDDTHLRFFTRGSIYDCFERAGFMISHLERVRLEPEATEFATDLSGLPPELVRLLRGHEESTTYQFILAARPASPGPGADAPQSALGEPAGTGRREAPVGAAIRWPPRPPGLDDEAGHWRALAEGLMEATVARAKFLEAERDRRLAELATLQLRLVRLETDVRDREARIRQGQAERQAEVRRLQAEGQAEVRRLQTELTGLHAHLTDLKSGRAWKLLERYRRLRLRLFPRAARRDQP